MELNYLNLNQTKNLIGIGLNTGFIIKDLHNKILIKKNIGIINKIELYYNSNIIFLIDNNELNILKIWN